MDVVGSSWSFAHFLAPHPLRPSDPAPCHAHAVQALVPAYQAFHAKYSSAAYTSDHKKHEKHSPGAVEALVGELFEGAEIAGAAGQLVGRTPSKSPGSSTGGSLGRRLSGRG